MEIKIQKTTAPKQKPTDETKLGFGHIFTDHMFVMEYDTGMGWHDARVVPFGDISLSPAAMVLHYGQEIFEGLKAYRTKDGSIQFFRPEENFKRLNVSAERLVIPQIPVEDALQALHTLVEVDKDWVPHTDGASLYIRPFIFAADPFLGVRPADKYYFMIILSPSGAYYSTGLMLKQSTFARYAAVWVTQRQAATTRLLCTARTTRTSRIIRRYFGLTALNRNT